MISSPARPITLTPASVAAPPIASALVVVLGEGFWFQGFIVRITYSTSPTFCSFLIVRVATEWSWRCFIRAPYWSYFYPVETNWFPPIWPPLSSPTSPTNKSCLMSTVFLKKRVRRDQKLKGIFMKRACSTHLQRLGWMWLSILKPKQKDHG